jgi:hypothetical protein
MTFERISLFVRCLVSIFGALNSNTRRRIRTAADFANALPAFAQARRYPPSFLNQNVAIGSSNIVGHSPFHNDTLLIVKRIYAVEQLREWVLNRAEGVSMEKIFACYQQSRQFHERFFRVLMEIEDSDWFGFDRMASHHCNLRLGSKVFLIHSMRNAAAHRHRFRVHVNVYYVSLDQTEHETYIYQVDGEPCSSLEALLGQLVLLRDDVDYNVLFAENTLTVFSRDMSDVLHSLRLTNERLVRFLPMDDTLLLGRVAIANFLNFAIFLSSQQYLYRPFPVFD